MNTEIPANKNFILAPSILSADFLKLGTEIEMLNQSEADWIHCDVMDGSFVPNISFGFPVIEQIAKCAKKPLDVHLMIVQPEKYINRLRDTGVFLVNVHFEACIHLHRTLDAIRRAGMKAGVTLNPASPVSLLQDILYMADLVLLMSVNPGFGGQVFIENTVEKVKTLKQMRDEKQLGTIIEVDGGVNMETGKHLLAAGADALVAGNYIFQSSNPTETIKRMKNELKICREQR